MRIDELLDMDQLCLDIENGYVTMRTHPENPNLHILNYADKCQYEPYWTDVTRKTRGLIYNSDTLEIIARPFEKFFNYGQESGVQFDLDATVFGAYDKMDGSLGIAYWDGTKYAIATRGSFESDQAIHATEWLHRPENKETLDMVEEEHKEGFTALFEIIYPENRIVVDYGAEDKLEYLGSSSMITEKAEFYPCGDLLVGHSYMTLREVLALPDRENSEGLVVWIDLHTAVKIKQQDYIELHRIVSSLSQKEIWRQLSAGTYDDFVVKLPDEFYGWADGVAKELNAQFKEVHNSVWILNQALLSNNFTERRDQAMWINEHVPSEYRGMTFLALDGRDYSASIWKMIEPVGANPMKIIVE